MANGGVRMIHPPAGGRISVLHDPHGVTITIGDIRRHHVHATTELGALELDQLIRTLEAVRDERTVRA